MENTAYKILLVDDEPDILEFISYNLRKENYEVHTASNGHDAITIARKELPHLIILDIMMPGMDGIETCMEMRQFPELQTCLITFLTARNEDFTQIAGLEAGADDYISKPVKPKVLMSKIKSLLRRPANQVNEKVKRTITIADLVIDPEKYIVIKDGKTIVLPRKEFELLFLLASKPNKVYTRESIFEQVWDSDVIVGDRTIDVHIRKIREKIGDHIKTVKGVGYKFEI